jgi:hypothetical protein
MLKWGWINLQGTEDDVVNWLHGNGLWKMAREPYEPLWIKGGGHCNLELYPDYIRHLCRFIQEMENITTAIRLKKIRPSLRRSSNRCCRIKIWRPKCPDCSRPSCIKCSWRPKCLECGRPCCPECWRPSCPECLRPSCPECLRPSCFKCCWRPKCPKCPKCSRPSCCMKCFSWQWCMGTQSGLNGKEEDG